MQQADPISSLILVIWEELAVIPYIVVYVTRMIWKHENMHGQLSKMFFYIFYDLLQIYCFL